VKIVGNENIGPAVLVDIAGIQAETKTEHIGRDTSRFGDVAECLAVVSEEFIGKVRVLFVFDLVNIQRATRVFHRGMIDQKQVEIAVFVVVKKGSLGGMSRGRPVRIPQLFLQI
jgi:hypothetical protein